MEVRPEPAELRHRGNRPLLQSDQYRGLDRSEKGAVSFFLGQVSAKHFAEHLLGSPVFTRVDEALEVAGLPVIGRRPDFHGYGPRVGVFATEAKGRSGIWNAKLMRDAKAQALNLPPVLGGGPHRAVAHAAYFERRQWKARIEDPPPTRLQRGPSVEAVLYAYYRPLVLLLEERDGPDFELDGEIYAMAELSEVDLRIGVRRDLLSADSGRSVGADGVLLLAGRAGSPRHADGAGQSQRGRFGLTRDSTCVTPQTATHLSQQGIR